VSKALGLPLSRGKRGKALGGVCAVFKKVVRHLGTPHRRPARRLTPAGRAFRLLTPSVIHPFSVRSLVRVVVCLKVADRRMQGYCNIASCRMRINPPNLQMHTGPHVIWSACQR